MFYYIFLLTIISVDGQNCPSSVPPPASICSNRDFRLRRNVYLSGFKDGEGDHTCQCSITLINVNPKFLIPAKPISSGLDIIDQNNIITPSCDYSLILVVKDQLQSTIYDCSKGSNQTSNFFMKNGDGEEVLLKLRNRTFNNAGFQFCLRFLTRENYFNLRLRCNKSVDQSTTATISTIPSTTPGSTTPSTTPGSTTPSTTPGSTKPSTITEQTQEQEKCNCEQEVDVIPWILFGLLLTLNLALLIFFLTRRYARRRKQKPAVIDRSRTYRNHTSSPNNQTSHSNQGENNQQQPEDAGTSVSYTNVPNNRIEGTNNHRNDLDTQYDSIRTAEQEATPYYTSLEEENDYIN